METKKLFNLNELNKDWEENFDDWDVKTLELTPFEEEIIKELTENVLPRHMPIHDWNLPYAEGCVLVLRRLMNEKLELATPKKCCMVCSSTDGVKRYKTNIDGQFYANGGDGYVEYCKKHADANGYTDEHLHSTHLE